MKCGCLTWKYSSNVTRRKCGVCANKIIIAGINDVLTTHPYIEKYAVNKEDFQNVSFGSHKKVLAKCPDCGLQKNISASALVNYGFSCKRCGDGISFPNKFLHRVLEQCNIEFESEKDFKWSNGKQYDYYIPSLDLIIENNGKQHYDKHGFITIGGRSLKEEQENDNQKINLALNNGIKYYIIIDCSISDMEYIKQSIINSELLTLLNKTESDIDWNSCLEYASKNILKQVSEIFNQNKGTLSTTDIGKIFHLSHVTISSYLKTGTILGWCDYNPKEENKRIGAINGHKKSKQIICLEYPDKIYENAKQCAIELFKYGYQLEENNIRATCRHVHKTYKGLHFEYYENYLLNNNLTDKTEPSYN